MAFNLDSREGVISYLQSEILRLQDLCAENFGKIDELKKENKKLQEVHTELKETTSDLAYSLAECPWWQKESLQAAVKILASFAQKIQYILELPTFIDPVEQLNRNGGFQRCEISKNVKPQLAKSAVTTPYVRTCQTCKKRFYKLSNYEIHKRVHPGKTKRLKCRVCSEQFTSFIEMKIHAKNFHSFANGSNSGGSDGDCYSNLRQILQRNNVKVWRFFKCKHCDVACSSTAALKSHMSICGSVLGSPPASDQAQGVQTPSTSSSKTPISISRFTTIVNGLNAKTCSSSKDGPVGCLVHEDTSEEDDEDIARPKAKDSTDEIQDLTITPITEMNASAISPRKENINECNEIEHQSNQNAPTEPTLTIASAPVRLSSMHSFSISSSSHQRPGEIVDGLPTEMIQELSAPYFLSSSSSSLESEVETSVVQESSTGESLRKFICTHSQCSKSFSTRGKLAHHRKTHVKTHVLLSCQFCGKEFHDKYRMKTHWLSHCPNGFSQKPVYRCLECGKFHRNLNELADHSKRAHSVSQLRKPLYSCASCGFTTNFRRKFDVHLKRKCKGRQVMDLNIMPQERKQYYYPAAQPQNVETCTSSTSNSLNN